MTGGPGDKKPSPPQPAQTGQKAQARPENLPDGGLPDGGLKESDSRVAPLADELQAHA